MLMRCVFDGAETRLVQMTVEEEAGMRAEWAANEALVSVQRAAKAAEIETHAKREAAIEALLAKKALDPLAPQAVKDYMAVKR